MFICNYGRRKFDGDRSGELADSPLPVPAKTITNSISLYSDSPLNINVGTKTNIYTEKQLNDRSLLQCIYSMALRIRLYHSLASTNKQEARTSKQQLQVTEITCSFVKDPFYPYVRTLPLPSCHLISSSKSTILIPSTSVWTSSRYQLFAARERPKRKKVVMTIPENAVQKSRSDS